MYIVHSLQGWPFLRKLASSGAVQWTEYLVMAQHFETEEAAEIEAFNVVARWRLHFDLEVLTLEEAKEVERKFKLAHHIP